jgi:hypothetical protein
MNGALKAALEQHAAYCRKQFGRIEPEWFVFPRMRDEAAPGSQAACGLAQKGLEFGPQGRGSVFSATRLQTSCRFFGHADFSLKLRDLALFGGELRLRLAT